MVLLRFCVYFRTTHELWNIHWRNARNISNAGINRLYFTDTSLKSWKKTCAMSDFEDISDFEYEEDISKDIDFSKLVDNDADKMKNLKMLQLKLDMWRQSGVAVPERLTESQWMELMNCDSHNSTLILLQLFYRREIAKKNIKEMKKIRQQKLVEVKKTRQEMELRKLTTSGPTIYDLCHCTLFHRIREPQINRLFNYKLMIASLYAPTILIDCSYEPYMSSRDTSALVKQISIMFSVNKDYFYPAHLLFCNLMSHSAMMEQLLKRMPRINELDYPFFSTSKHYLDLYPKEKLVYLTPDAKNYLEEFNCNDLYIIGGFVDWTRDEPLSRTKALREGLRMAKFPIEEEIKLSQNGRKSLPLDKVISILNDLRTTRNWRYAKRHIQEYEKPGTLKEDLVEAGRLSLTSKSLGEQFRRNEIYDLLLKRNRCDEPD